MPDTWREQVDIARTIRGILDSYPSNSILREIIQNSDDAAATKQIFILDHRQHGTNSVIENALKRSQGPALLAVNDSVFNDEDWTAVRTIYASSKSGDETTTGKYGLGIRACYHITDNMHILSKDTLAISDPHGEFERFPGGVNISLKVEQDQYQDQLIAFSAALKHIPSYSEATVIRLPLRTSTEASRSRIKPLPVTVSNIQSLYRSFIENELSVALLFLKHVMAIELWEIDKNGNDILVAKVAISNPEIAPLRSFVPGHDEASTSYSLKVLFTVCDAKPISESWCITHSALSERSVQQIMDIRLGYDVGICLREDKLVSHIALAFPLSGQSIQGRLFTLLPLPIPTGLPLHIHGIFALTPDRQSLRNPEELGIGVKSRERLLVTWNCMLFENLLPMAWLHLLCTLAHLDSVTGWSAWPPQNSLIPLANSLLSRLVNLALAQENDIFPAQIEGKSVLISSHLAALIAKSTIDQELVQAISMTAIPVIVPPSHIFNVLEEAELKGPECNFRFFDAQTLCTSLRQRISRLKGLQDADKDRILNCLICSSSSYIAGLPLIPTVEGVRISLSRPNSSSRRYVLATAAEAEIFGSYDSDMINLSDLSDTVRENLQQCSDGQELNVVRLGPYNMKEYLVKIVGVHPADKQVNCTEPISWFAAFWAWIDDLDNPEEYLAVASTFHLLPMLDNTIRHVSSKGFLIPHGQNDLFKVLRTAGVPFLHQSVSSTNSLSVFTKILSVDNFLELINFTQPDIQEPTDRLILQKHLVKCLQKEDQIPILSTTQQANFSVLPIFPTRVSDVPIPVTQLNSAIGHLQFINIDDSNFPLPILENVTFIDMSKPSRVLGLALQPNALSCALKEVELMKVAIVNLSKQPHELQDSLMRTIIPRLFHLTEETRETLRHQRFIPAIGSHRRVSPADIISPDSPLAALFKGEMGRFPVHPYTDPMYLGMMNTAKLFCTRLSSTMLGERIRHLSSSVLDPARIEKAEILFQLLSEQWHPSFAEVIQTDIQTAWIPVSSGGLAARQYCRDVKPGEHHFLFDLVLSRVSTSAKKEPLHENVRYALGWTTSLSFDILHRQLQATLDQSKLADRPERLLCLIQYIAKQYSNKNFTLADLGLLQGIVQNCEWIPLSGSKLAQTKHALLSLDLRIGTTFWSLPTELQDKDCVKFLRTMGCSERPTVDALVEALQKATSLTEIVSLLSELSSHEGEITLHQRDYILVPDQDSTLRTLSNVYFNDMGDRSVYITLKDELFPVHSAISRLVSQGLGIPFLSSLQLDDDDNLDIDDDDMDMSESLVARIKTVLVEYDIQYSFNEFLANAADAGACQFGVVLDTSRHRSDHILCPEMEIFQHRPAMVLFNDATFSLDDFRGLRNVGEGGKQSINGTIGKFGLGALSFYQFSEVALIISGEYIFILNPEGVYLPKRRGRMRRSLWRKLKDFRRRFADHLSPFNGLFGFSSKMDSYNGTLIRLPLRLDSPSRLSNIAVPLAYCRELIMGPYRDLSQAALFFTSLTRISAKQRLRDGTMEHLWLIDGQLTQSVKSADNDSAEHSILTIRHMARAVDLSHRWLIIKDSVPAKEVPGQLLGVVQQLKAMGGINISLAFCLDEMRLRPYHLFSGLRLPEVHSVPAHFNAAFAVASDRRRIQFDPPDSSGRRPLQSSYNAWLLSHAIPLLYLRGLQSLFYNNPLRRKVTDWLPESPQGLVSEVFTNALYASLPHTDLKVFPTVTGAPIAPRNAIISSDEPEPVQRLLIHLKIPNYVVLGSATSLVPKDQLPMLSGDSLTSILHQADVEERLQELFRAELSMRGRLPELSESPGRRRMEMSSMVDATISFLIKGKSSAGGHVPQKPKRGSKLRLPRMDIISMLDATISFLIRGRKKGKDDKDGLTGSHALLLLITKDLVLRRFGDNSPTYCFHDDLPDDFPYSLFPPSEFLSDEISSETKNLLIGLPSYHVQKFNGPAVLKFVVRRVGEPCDNTQHSDETIEWIDLFWKYFKLGKLPGDLEFEHLSEYPLFMTFKSGFVSLKHCYSGKVLPDPNINELRDIMHSLGVPVLREHIMLENDNRLKFSFRHFFECLVKRGGNPLEQLTRAQAEWLVKWVIEQIPSGLHELDPTHRNLLKQLPLWKATRNGLIQHLSANEILPLPPNVMLSTVKCFLDPNQSIAEFTAELQMLCDRQSTTVDLGRMLHLHDSISEDDLADYKYLLQKLIQGHATNLKLPDGRLRLRSHQDLFDSTVDLFIAAFYHSQDEMFVHPNFRDLQGQSLNVTTFVTFDIFRQCAQAIHGDQLQNREDQIVNRAFTVYQYYNHQLHHQITAANQKDLDDICFIPRRTVELNGVSYDTNLYFAGNHDAVASPNMLLRQEFQYLAWTQRSRFGVEPTAGLISVHPSIGVPTAEEVVSHLLILATQVAKDHPHNRTLIRDLKSIYNWLQDNRLSAATTLALKKHKHEPIFLNVDDIDDDYGPWQWRSSQELVLNLPYDSQRCFKIASFLLEFRELLVAAGVRQRVDVTHEDETQFGDPKFERLRASAKLLDIELKPEFPQEDERVDSSRLKAHAAFLAANVPHIENALTGGWNEAKSGILSFPGTYFAARTFLDLLYTGDVNDERPEEDEAAMILLKDLLEMLPVAQMWDLPKLTKKLGWLITVKFSFIQPETLAMIQSEAEEYGATELVTACKDFAIMNAAILEDLVDSETIPIPPASTTTKPKSSEAPIIEAPIIVPKSKKFSKRMLNLFMLSSKK